MSDLIFTTEPALPVDTLNLDADLLLGQRVAICRNALGDLIERDALPVVQRNAKMMIDEGKGWRTLTRHEVAALLTRAVRFERQVGNTFQTRQVDPPGNLVSAVFAHPPEALIDMASRPDNRTGELWVAFLSGWWLSHQSARVSVAKLAAQPGINDLAPVLGDDDHGRRVGLGRLLGERAGIPVEIEPEPAERLTVAPMEAGKERSGARLYLLDRRGEGVAG